MSSCQYFLIFFNLLFFTSSIFTAISSKSTRKINKKRLMQKHSQKYICDFHVINIWITCNSHMNHIRFPYESHLHMTSYVNVIHVWIACNSHMIHMLLGLLCCVLDSVISPVLSPIWACPAVCFVLGFSI